ncbi:MAG: hypothetical protein JEY97_02000 [Bacteroidales bacterium]|nr:hypothetical protein [Bacteroidales bacterium]
MKWIEIKNEIIRELLSRGLETPKRRINELDNLEMLFRKNFPELLKNPKEMFKKTDKNTSKDEVAKFKSNGKLNGAESSLINEIYKMSNK